MFVAAVLLGQHQGLALPWKSYQAGAAGRGGNLLVCSLSASTCWNSALCLCKMQMFTQNANVYAKPGVLLNADLHSCCSLDTSRGFASVFGGWRGRRWVCSVWVTFAREVFSPNYTSFALRTKQPWPHHAGHDLCSKRWLVGMFAIAWDEKFSQVCEAQNRVRLLKQSWASHFIAGWRAEARHHGESGCWGVWDILLKLPFWISLGVFSSPSPNLASGLRYFV